MMLIEISVRRILLVLTVVVGAYVLLKRQQGYWKSIKELLNEIYDHTLVQVVLERLEEDYNLSLPVHNSAGDKDAERLAGLYKRVLQGGGVTPPGEMGRPVVIIEQNLSEEEKAKREKGWKTHDFDELASDLIGAHRNLPDPRHPKCKEHGRYSSSLPSTSIIICFYNEALSALIRTVHSILERTPHHLIKEVILVDDFSDLNYLKGPLNTYMAIPKVRIIRNQKREGLIRSRIIATGQATAETVTFLDSHCEVFDGWLEPLLDAVVRQQEVAAVPVVEIISNRDFSLHITDCSRVHVGGFDWSLNIWMCGGRVEVLPCSHVGHVFRAKNPLIESNYEKMATMFRDNLVRIAKVWIEDRAPLVMYKMGLDDNIGGDISDALTVKRKLGCKSFDWYMKHIYTDFYDIKGAQRGAIVNVGNPNSCLDTMGKHKPGLIQVYQCHNWGGNQFWTLTHDGHIRQEQLCISYNEDGLVLRDICHSKDNKKQWTYDEENLSIKPTGRNDCITFIPETKEIGLVACKNDKFQQWKFQVIKER